MIRRPMGDPAPSQQLDRVLSALPVAVYVCAPDGALRFWNGRAVELWGREPSPGDPQERFCGSFRLLHLDGRPMPHASCPMADALRTGESTRGEVQIERPDGSRLTASVQITPLRDRHGALTGAVNVFQDITAEQQAQAAIQLHLQRERAARAEADAARAEAERASQAKDEFLAMLAHELRNPLGVVATAIAVIESASPDDARYERARRAIRRQTEHLSRMLDDLLDVARITKGRIQLHRTDLDLRAIVELGVDSERHRLEERRQRLTLSVPPQPVIVSGDSVRLQQVLGNLLNNASKYSSPGGEIAVVLDVEGDRAVLRVRDDGAGIASDRLEWIFELFTQANPTFARTEGGLGIGLTVARRLVELHGGRIRAASDGVDRGAEFLMEIPLARRAVLETRAAPAAAPPVASRRVLVIEDHDDGREMLVTALRLFGHEVFEAATGREGIEQAERHGPDVVLVDIGLPDIQGYDVARALRRSGGSTARIVALTGYGGPADRERSAEAGFDAHLLKPIDPIRLVGVLEDLG